MDVYAHEKEQIAAIREWWRENRNYIIAGLVVSALAVGGWRYWQAWQRQQSEAASARYEELVKQADAGDRDALRAGVAALQGDYAGTPYAALATMRLAAEDVAANEFAPAAEALRWVMDNTDDDELALLARLRLARVLLQQGEHAAVEQLLAGGDFGKFQPLFDELRGDALLLKGDRDGARAAYEAALAGMESGDRRLLEMKLGNLALPVESLTQPAAAPAVENEPAGDDGA